MSKKGRVINLNKPEPLTIERLRTYKGLENLSDEEAEKIVDALMKFARITVRAYRILADQEQESKKAA